MSAQLRVQALGGLEHRLRRVQAPQLVQGDAGVVQQPRLARLALERVEDAAASVMFKRRRSAASSAGGALRARCSIKLALAQ